MILSPRKKRYTSIAIPLSLTALFGIFYFITQEKAHIVGNDEAEKVICGDRGQNDDHVQCWISSIKEMIKSKGMHATFAAISDRFMNESSFKRSCNAILYDVGRWTYHETARGNITFSVPPHVTLCAHAFDRAFVHELTAATGDFAKAIVFCTDPQLASESPEATASCSHGIGHGAFGFYASRNKDSDPQTVITSALAECGRISSTPLQLNFCTGGVFDEVVQSYKIGGYGLSLRKDDPFAFCRQQADAYKRMCYASAKPLLLWVTNNDFFKSAALVAEIPEDEYAAVAIDALASSVAAGNITRGVLVADYAAAIDACRVVQKRLRAPCTTGLAIELLTHSMPADAITFCRLPALTDMERDTCFERVLLFSHDRYSVEKHRNICMIVPERYRRHCDA